MMRTPGRRHARGFTLVEVLIALTLMAMLMLLLTAAMRNMGQTETAVQERIAQTDDYRTTVNFLRDVLGEVSARPLAKSVVQPDAPQVMFQGSATELTWIGMLPARHGLGGRHHMRLMVDAGDLVLDFAPWQGEAALKDWRDATRLVLAPQVESLSLRYQDPRDGYWVEVWPPEGQLAREFALPSAVQIDMVGGWSWPGLVVAVSGALASDPATVDIPFGGGSR